MGKVFCKVINNRLDQYLDCGGEPCSTQPQSQSSAGDPRDGTVVGEQRRGKFGKFSHSGRVTGKLSTCIIDDSCKTGSAYTGRVVNGRIARAASRVLLLLTTN